MYVTQYCRFPNTAAFSSAPKAAVLGGRLYNRAHPIAHKNITIKEFEPKMQMLWFRPSIISADYRTLHRYLHVLNVLIVVIVGLTTCPYMVIVGPPTYNCLYMVI